MKSRAVVAGGGGGWWRGTTGTDGDSVVGSKRLPEKQAKISQQEIDFSSAADEARLCALLRRCVSEGPGV